MKKVDPLQNHVLLTLQLINRGTSCQSPLTSKRQETEAVFLSRYHQIYKALANFDKRDAFKCHIIRIPSNIPPTTFYCSALSEFVRIARSTSLLKISLPVAKNLLDRVINQGDSKYMRLR